MLQSPSGLPIKNGTLAFNLQQAGLIVGTGAVVPLTANCYTSIDGSVVGLPNPTANVIAAVNYGSGTLPGGIYYVETTFYSGSQETLPSPELRIQLTGTGTLTISPPISFPANAAGMRVYIGATSGAEQLEGQTASPTAQFAQSVPLASGAAPPATNTSVCSIAFNDTIIPFSGYNVSLTSSTGNAYPGWPQSWQLNGGTNGTVNVSQGAPLWNGVTIYPQPILAQPLNHGPQSISGPLNMSGYNLVDVGNLGAGGNVTPAWPIDANGLINASGGYLYNGAAPLNHVLLGNGTAYVDSATIPVSAISGLTLRYQTLQANGTAEPQESAANFSSAFSLTDNSGVSTNVDLAASGVTAGSYTNPSITVNAKGQVTAASNGAHIPIVQGASSGAGCTTASTSYSVCTMSVTWPVAFADTIYQASCTPIGPTDSGNPTSGRATENGITAKSTTGVTFQVSTAGSNAISYTGLDCIGVHE